MKVIRSSFIALGIIILFPGCYIIRQSYYQLRLFQKSKSVEQVLQQSSVSDKIKGKIILVQKVRWFAINELSLKKTKSYRKYIQLNGRYVAYNLSASYKKKLQPLIWKFPVVGQVPYLGFFNLNDALKEQKRLNERGFDTRLRKISAYSTIGFFNDPLLSSMTNYSDPDLINVVIHEMTHGTIFIKGDVKFNEALATFVGNKGTLLYLEKYKGKQSKEYQYAFYKEKDNVLFASFINKLIPELQEFYERQKSEKEILIKREVIFKKSQLRFNQEILQKLKTDTYRQFSKLKLNNAIILSYRRYYQDLVLFDKLYHFFQQDLVKTIVFLKRLEKIKGKPQQFIIKWLRY